MYRICIGTLFILTITLFILHIFYEAPDIDKDLIFSYKNLSPAASNLELANIN